MDSIWAQTNIFALAQLAKPNLPSYFSSKTLLSLNSVPRPPLQDLFPSGGNRHAFTKAYASWPLLMCRPVVPCTPLSKNRFIRYALRDTSNNTHIISINHPADIVNRLRGKHPTMVLSTFIVFPIYFSQRFLPFATDIMIF